MARGWESKSVESQQADVEGAAKRRPELSPEERRRLEEIRSLELALARTQAELGTACRPAHRDMLHQRLTAIQEALQKLS